MKFRSNLPQNRESPGTFWVEDAAGAVLFGPVRARGEADNANAAKVDNVIEDPARVGGDHPGGLYRVSEVVQIQSTDSAGRHSYGPYFLRLDPQGGEALAAKQSGRHGIGIHGGDLGAGGILRVTFGCLRVDNDTIVAVAKLIEAEFIAQFVVLYECSIGIGV